MKCNGCGTEKTGEDFHRHNKGGRQPRCKECQRRYHKEHYKKNKAKYVAKAETLRLANRATAMQFINELKAAPCRTR
jgi:NAD-dependent SIR2 family protein deacetylase